MKCVIKFLNWVNWLSLAVELLLKTNTRLYSVPYENIPPMSQQSFGKSHKNGPETHSNLVNTARTKHSSTTPRGRQSKNSYLAQTFTQRQGDKQRQDLGSPTPRNTGECDYQ